MLNFSIKKWNFPHALMAMTMTMAIIMTMAMAMNTLQI
jgi:hypothetical protein